MSYLQMSGLFDNADWAKAAGSTTDVFGLRAKEARKAAEEQQEHERMLQAQTFEQRRLVSQDEREAAAVDRMRDRVRLKVQEIEQVALSAAQAMEKARKLIELPQLAGDPVLEEVESEIGSLEVAVVQIQAGTVVDTATFDTKRLAVAYSDAQAGLIAMRSILSRALGVVEKLEGRLNELKAERRRLQELERQRQAQLAQEKARQRAAEAAAREREQKARQEAERQARLERIQAIRRLDDQIARERAAIRRLKTEVVEIRARAAERAALARS